MNIDAFDDREKDDLVYKNSRKTTISLVVILVFNLGMIVAFGKYTYDNPDYKQGFDVE